MVTVLWCERKWLFASIIAFALSPANAQQGAKWHQTEKQDCDVWSTYAGAETIVTWSGSCSAGRADGYGVLVYSFTEGDEAKKATYTGTLLSGKRHGKGVMLEANGIRYNGEWRDHFRNGRGVSVWPAGTYDGEWVNDQPNGRGLWVGANGDRYEGDFRHARYHGRGTIVWANGDRYEGAWLEGLRSGPGVFVWANGDRYEGNWRLNRRNGRGVFIGVDGDRYEGEWLHDHRVSINPPLHRAARTGNLALLQESINSGEDLDERDQAGYTALHHAARIGNADAAQILIDAGADVNLPTLTQLMQTPLHFGVAYAEIAKLFVQSGADLNARAWFGETPFLSAAGDGNIRSVKLLAAAGANIHAKTFEGETALHKAVRSGSAGTVRVLLRMGLDPNGAPEIEPFASRTPIHLAKVLKRRSLEWMLRNPTILIDPLWWAAAILIMIASFLLVRLPNLRMRPFGAALITTIVVVLPISVIVVGISVYIGLLEAASSPSLGGDRSSIIAEHGSVIAISGIVSVITVFLSSFQFLRIFPVLLAAIFVFFNVLLLDFGFEFLQMDFCLWAAVTAGCISRALLTTLEEAGT